MKTADTTVTASELRGILGLEWGEKLDPYGTGVIQTCAGEWRREANGRWRAWADEETDNG